MGISCLGPQPPAQDKVNSNRAGLSSLSCPAPGPVTAVVPQSDTVKADTWASILHPLTPTGECMWEVQVMGTYCVSGW